MRPHLKCQMEAWRVAAMNYAQDNFTGADKHSCKASIRAADGKLHIIDSNGHEHIHESPWMEGLIEQLRQTGEVHENRLILCKIVYSPGERCVVNVVEEFHPHYKHI
jgi:hypothetical protein